MTLKNRLRRYGVTMSALIDTALEMYIYDPKLGSDKKMRRALGIEFEKALKDINVSCLVLAGILLEEALSKGALPAISKKKYRSDPVDLIADEMLGMQIANYIAGARSIFEFERFDKAKPGILSKLPPILDDVVAGLISGALVKVCSR